MTLKVDINLAKKYNRPGPRYTSYPTAPHFTDTVKLKDWEQTIIRNNTNPDRDLSLYAHLPFCDTLCWFCACTTVITRDTDKIGEYLQVLYREIDLLKTKFHKDRKIIQMHYGGGTPTYLSPLQIKSLGNKIKDSFKLAENAEIGCEMDPRGLTRDHIIALRETGFNRASMGVQDFNPEVQKAVNRINPPEMINQVMEWIRAEGFNSLNLDLIYGLPLQTKDSFKKTINMVLELNPDRLAVFNYAHVPWLKPHQNLIKEADMPSPAEKLEMLKMIIETLTSSGYVYIGMDHFAKENDELTVAQREKTLQRNFQGYSTKGGVDIYALGMSSISQVDDIYVQNYKDISKYTELIDRGSLPFEKGFMLNADDQIRRQVIMRLMCDMELNYENISKILKINFQKYFSRDLSGLQAFEEDNLIILNDKGFTVTDTGRLFIRNIAMIFDVYLENNQARYSKTI